MERWAGHATPAGTARFPAAGWVSRQLRVTSGGTPSVTQVESPGLNWTLLLCSRRIMCRLASNVQSLAPAHLAGVEATGAPGPAGRAGPFGELVLSSLGVGTYLGAADGPTDEAVANAIVQARLPSCDLPTEGVGICVYSVLWCVPSTRSRAQRSLTAPTPGLVPRPAMCKQSVANGWNVIDTAANYRCGRPRCFYFSKPLSLLEAPLAQPLICIEHA